VGVLWREQWGERKIGDGGGKVHKGKMRRREQ
jgi:hypothetical protein